jgi:hypothetical protein
MLAQSSGAFQFFASCTTFPVGETRPNDVQSGGHYSQLKQERIPGDMALSVKLLYIEHTLSAALLLPLSRQAS